MIRVANITEKNVFPAPPEVITIPVNGTGTVVLQDISGGALAPYAPSEEIMGRYIQNTGANTAFYALGQDKCDGTVNYHGMLAASQQFDASNFAGKVTVYSLLGTTIATTVLRRKDLSPTQQQFPALVP